MSNSEPKATPIELDGESYRRWLDAQRPPMSMFFRLPVTAQEELARIGKEHWKERTADVAKLACVLLDWGSGDLSKPEDAEEEFLKTVTEGLRRPNMAEHEKL